MFTRVYRLCLRCNIIYCIHVYKCTTEWISLFPSNELFVASRGYTAHSCGHKKLERTQSWPNLCPRYTIRRKIHGSVISRKYIYNNIAIRLLLILIPKLFVLFTLERDIRAHELRKLPEVNYT